MAVPGVTGGSVSFTYASFDPRVACDLTSSAATKDELESTLYGVLEQVADVTRPYDKGTVIVAISNGTDSVGEGQRYGSLKIEILRQRYPGATP